MPTSRPSLRHRLVGDALRFFREQLGLSMQEAAGILDCHVSKISRIETGHRGIKAIELRELLREYDASDAQADLLHALLGYARPLPKLHWWWDAADVLPSSVLDYAMVEEHASGICTYGATLIPPLMQTHAYARAVAFANPSGLGAGGRYGG
jgi:transcriptional regulator with XRE-family HTH domain